MSYDTGYNDIQVNLKPFCFIFVEDKNEQSNEVMV
jgi:hypothetical protein